MSFDADFIRALATAQNWAPMRLGQQVRTVMLDAAPSIVSPAGAD